MDDDREVVELPEAPQDLDAVISIIIEQVSEADLANLPDAAAALQVLSQPTTTDGDSLTADGQGGALVDAAGNALPVATEAERQAALAVLIETIRDADPSFFDEVTIKSASPNQ
jgi:hypothetical protein